MVRSRRSGEPLGKDSNLVLCSLRCFRAICFGTSHLKFTLLADPQHTSSQVSSSRCINQLALLPSALQADPRTFPQRYQNRSLGPFSLSIVFLAPAQPYFLPCPQTHTCVLPLDVPFYAFRDVPCSFHHQPCGARLAGPCVFDWSRKCGIKWASMKLSCTVFISVRLQFIVHIHMHTNRDQESVRAACCTDSKSRKIEASEIRTSCCLISEHAPELPTRLYCNFINEALRRTYIQ